MNKTRCRFLWPQHIKEVLSDQDHGRSISALWSRRRESNPHGLPAHGKDDMNIGGVDVSGQQYQKGDFCVCRASAPTALLRREWGGRAGGDARLPVGVGRA